MTPDELKAVREEVERFSCQEHGRSFVDDCLTCDIPRLAYNLLAHIDMMQEYIDAAPPRSGAHNKTALLLWMDGYIEWHEGRPGQVPESLSAARTSPQSDDSGK